MTPKCFRDYRILFSCLRDKNSVNLLFFYFRTSVVRLQLVKINNQRQNMICNATVIKTTPYVRLDSFALLTSAFHSPQWSREHVFNLYI